MHILETKSLEESLMKYRRYFSEADSSLKSELMF